MKICNFYSSVCTRTKLPENYLNLHQVNRQTILYFLVLFLSRGLVGGEGATQQRFMQGGSVPRWALPLTLSYTVYERKVRHLHKFN